MDGGRKRKLCKDVNEHVVCGAPDESDGALLDDIADVVVFDVDLFGLEVVMSLEAREMHLSLSSKVEIGPARGEPIVGRSWRRNITS